MDVKSKFAKLAEAFEEVVRALTKRRVLLEEESPLYKCMGLYIFGYVMIAKM